MAYQVGGLGMDIRTKVVALLPHKMVTAKANFDKGMLQLSKTTNRDYKAYWERG
jgi:hypothetical protein